MSAPALAVLIAFANCYLQATARLLPFHTAFTLSFPPLESTKMQQSSRVQLGRELLIHSGKSMKKILLCSLMVLAAVAVAAAQQSLGDAARKARSEKRGTATVRLEGDGLSVPENQPGASDSSNKAALDASDAQAGAKPSDAQIRKGADADKQRADDWNAKIDAQRREVGLLQRELDVATREQRMRSASYYGDPAAQAQNSAKYMEDSHKAQDQIDAKKKDLDQAQQKLDDLMEQARKAGVRVSQ
jgi:hypothetical protein